MGLRQMLYEEGKQDGIEIGRKEERVELLRRSIRFGLKMKFGEADLKLIDRIQEIEDPLRLEQIMNVIESMTNGNLHNFQKQIDL